MASAIFLGRPNATSSRLGLCDEMPRFHFNVHNTHGSVTDEEGANFPDLATAQAQAVHIIRALLSHEVLDGRIDFNGYLDIIDERGKTLASVPFKDAVIVFSSD